MMAIIMKPTAALAIALWLLAVMVMCLLVLKPATTETRIIRMPAETIASMRFAAMAWSRQVSRPATMVIRRIPTAAVTIALNRAVVMAWFGKA